MKVPTRAGCCQLLAKGKGVRGEVKSEGILRQKPDLRATNPSRGCYIRVSLQRRESVSAVEWRSFERIPYSRTLGIRVQCGPCLLATKHLVIWVGGGAKIYLWSRFAVTSMARLGCQQRIKTIETKIALDSPQTADSNSQNHLARHSSGICSVYAVTSFFRPC